VPLYKTITNINIDGIAFFRDFVSLIGIGNDYSTLSKTLELVAEENGMFVEEIPDQFRKYDAFNKSDQLAFAIGGIPSVLVLEGTINKSKNKDEVVNAFVDYFFIHYHKPSDDLKQNIDYDAAAKHAKVLLDLCIHLANDEEEPEWKTGSPYINARLRSAAEKR